MDFYESLQVLRKEHNLSQEQLADKLNVSRQAVSKWESGASYPEMDKLIAMSEIFGCTLDDLVHGNVKTSEINLGKKYDELYNSFSKVMAFAVGFILLGVATLLFINGLASPEDEDLFGVISVVVFFCFILVSVPCFIIYGTKMDNFAKKYPSIPENYYNEDEIESFSKKFSIAIAVGVGLIIFGVITVVGCSVIFGDDSMVGVVIFMLLIAIATTIIVYYGVLSEKYDIPKYNKKIEYQNKIANGEDKYSGAIMLTATMVYLILGFVFNMWHPGWVVFPVGGLLCAIVGSLKK